jgi:hypothetical protein
VLRRSPSSDRRDNNRFAGRRKTRNPGLGTREPDICFYSLLSSVERESMGECLLASVRTLPVAILWLSGDQSASPPRLRHCANVIFMPSSCFNCQAMQTLASPAHHRRLCVQGGNSQLRVDLHPAPRRWRYFSFSQPFSLRTYNFEHSDVDRRNAYSHDSVIALEDGLDEYLG